MPDSLPPPDGPAPYDERDLYALLSDRTAGVPEPLVPVARALDALCAAPVPAELDGEAAARAAFRLLTVPGEGRPGQTAASQAGGAAMLMRPARQAGGPPAVVRHSHRRPRVRRQGPWQAMALAGTAAAAVVAVGVMALAGAFSGPGGHQEPPGHPAAPAAESSGRSTSQVFGAGAKDKTASPAPSASTTPEAAGPAELCSQYFAFIARPGRPSGWAAEDYIVRRLTGLAGSVWNINAYCYAQLGEPDPAPPGSFPGSPGGGPGYPGHGNPPGRGPGLSGAAQSGFGVSTGGRR